MLGHHVDPHTSSPLQLQVIVYKMLRSVGAGWDPDLPRPQRLYEELRATFTDLDECDGAVAYGQQVDQEDDVLSEVEQAFDIEDSLEDAAVTDKVFIAASKADGRILQHQSSGALRFVGLDNRFMCGRFINNMYTAVKFDLSHEWAICQQCRHMVGEELLASTFQASVSDASGAV